MKASFFLSVFLSVFLFAFFVLVFSASASAACGNFVCESNESKCSCPQDCGSCSGSVPNQLCANYTCDPNNLVCQIVLKRPCCGNSECEIGESFANCPLDCAPKRIVITVSGVNEYTKYLRGDSIVFSAKVLGDGVPVKQASVNISGPFGQLSMFDDGKHSDGKKDDAVYANTWTIPQGIGASVYSLTVNVEKLGSFNSASVKMNIDPSLDFNVFFAKSQFLLGDIISLNGFVKRRGNPLSQKIVFSAFDENHVVISGFSQEIVSDFSGNFSFDYHTSQIEPVGEWKINANSTDEFGNLGSFEKTIKVASADQADFLQMHFLVPSETTESILERGEEIKVLAELFFNDLDLEQANVKAIFADKYVVQLTEFAPGKYGGKFSIPFDFPLGIVEVKGLASKPMQKVTYTGSTSAKILVREATVAIEVVEPASKVFAVGENIIMVFSLKYPSGMPVSGIDLNAVASDGRKVSFKDILSGVYGASLLVLPQNMDGLSVSVSATDSYKNKGRIELPFEILETKSILYFFSSDPIIVLAFGVAFVALAVVFVFLVKRRSRMNLLEKRAAELSKLREELQENYFSRGIIDKKEYYSLMAQYTSELEKINASMDSLKRNKKIPKEQPVSGVQETQKTAQDAEAEEKPIDLFKIEKKEQEKEIPDEGFFSFKKKDSGEKK